MLKRLLNSYVAGDVFSILPWAILAYVLYLIGSGVVAPIR